MGGSSVLKHISSGFESNWVSKKSDARSVLANDEEAAMYGSSKKKIKKKEQPLLDDEKHALTETFGNLITWVGNTDSNKMETIMQNSLMDHELDRWGSIVVHDKIQNFFETSVYIPANALLLSPDQLFPFIESAHKRMCDETSRNKINGKNGPDTDNSVENLWKMEKSLLFCGEDASTRIGVAKMYNSTTKQQSKALVITAYASLQSNVTLICNTTTHHAAPIFLKEFVASAYSSIGKVDMKYKEDLSKKGNKYEDNDDTAPTLDDDNRKEIRGREMQFKGSPQYDLFSFPFAELDLMNEGSMWRGYLGASFVLIFMLISTMISVRFISEFRASGVKHLIHLSGVSVSSYWIANYIFDTMVMFSILFAVYCAVYLGGNPIRSFYFDLPPFTGFLFFSVIVAFSFAIVAANYAFCALAADALACQLGCVLLSIIFGVCVKLYIQLHKSSNFSQLSTVLTIVSPSYAFTSALFDMFGQYASNIGKSSGILTELNCPGLLAAVFFDVMAMFGQAVGYLFITMMIDRYWVLIKVFWGNALPSLYRMIRSINKLFGHAWNGVRSASVMSLTSMEADFSLQSLWPGFNGNSTAANQGASGAIYESELTASAIGEMAPLIAQLGLPRNYSDPDLFDEEKGDYGSIWDISKSELKLSHSTSLHALHSDDHASYSGDSDKADSAAILDSVIESTPIIVVRDLSMEYPWQHVPAIHNINMTVSSGNRVALVGVNGGGNYKFGHAF